LEFNFYCAKPQNAKKISMDLAHGGIPARSGKRRAQRKAALHGLT